MNEPITLAQMWQVIIALFAGIATISGGVGVITKIVTKAKQPERKQNERIEALEISVKEINMRLERGNVRFDSDKDRIDALEQTMKSTNRVIIESLQALTAHAIDGNNTSQLKNTEKMLNDYLIGKI